MRNNSKRPNRAAPHTLVRLKAGPPDWGVWEQPADRPRSPAAPLLFPAQTQAELSARLTAFIRSHTATFPAPQGPAAQPSLHDLRDLEARLAADAAPLQFSRGRPLDLVLGFDLGTTSTKLVVRLPYESGQPSFAIPVPDFAQAEAHPYLWTTMLWEAAGAYSLAPLPGAVMHHAIKATLMTAGSPDANNAEQVAAAFMALQLRQARGWMLTRHSTLLRQGTAIWNYNFGFPAASLENLDMRGRYERAAAAATLLAGAPDPITIESVCGALEQVRDDAAKYLKASGINLIPEITAAVAGFARSTRLDSGLYALVDVGGSTVDACTFNLFPNAEGRKRCPIFETDVQLLGTLPWRMCMDHLQFDGDFRRTLAVMQQAVIVNTKRRRDPNSERWRNGLTVFFIGGGVASPIHNQATHGLDEWSRRVSCSPRGVMVRSLPLPDNVNAGLCDETKLHRLAVAVGLSMPEDEMPEVELPSTIEDIAPLLHAAYEDWFTGKEQV